MENWKKDARRDVGITDIDALVPKDHLLRKIERIMDYDWLYEKLAPYYNQEVGRPGTDPVVLIKMVLIEHLYGIPSLRQTYQRIGDTISYRWFLGYGLLDEMSLFELEERLKQLKVREEKLREEKRRSILQAKVEKEDELQQRMEFSSRFRSNAEQDAQERCVTLSSFLHSPSLFLIHYLFMISLIFILFCSLYICF